MKEETNIWGNLLNEREMDKETRLMPSAKVRNKRALPHATKKQTSFHDMLLCLPCPPTSPECINLSGAPASAKGQARG